VKRRALSGKQLAKALEARDWKLVAWEGTLRAYRSPINPKLVLVFPYNAWPLPEAGRITISVCAA
jgi:hypothetical protein